jgi:hypothetical protein
MLEKGKKYMAITYAMPLRSDCIYSICARQDRERGDFACRIVFSASLYMACDLENLILLFAGSRSFSLVGGIS